MHYVVRGDRDLTSVSPIRLGITEYTKTPLNEKCFRRELCAPPGFCFYVKYIYFR